MGLEISKHYSYSFHPISAKLYQDIGYNRGIQAITFLGWCGYKGGIQAITILGNQPSLNFWELWNFNMRANGKIVKCAIFWKWLTVEQNRWKCGTHSPRNSICSALSGSGHLSSAWGHSVHFPKFPMLRFSKGYCCHSFHPISTKLYGKHGN